MLDILSQIWTTATAFDLELHTSRSKPVWTWRTTGIAVYGAESEPAENWAELADYPDAATVNIDGRVAQRELVEAIMDTDRPVLAYTINDPQLARTLRQLGVDAMFTDDPDTVNDSLFKNH